MFNKEGKRENPLTLAEQINKVLDEKIKQSNKPTQETIKNILIKKEDITPPTENFISPLEDLQLQYIQPKQEHDYEPIPPKLYNPITPKLYKSEPETLSTIMKRPRISKERINDDLIIYKPKKNQNNNTNNNMICSWFLF